MLSSHLLCCSSKGNRTRVRYTQTHRLTLHASVLATIAHSISSTPYLSLFFLFLPLLFLLLVFLLLQLTSPSYFLYFSLLCLLFLPLMSPVSYISHSLLIAPSPLPVISSSSSSTSSFLQAGHSVRPAIHVHYLSSPFCFFFFVCILFSSFRTPKEASHAPPLRQENPT